jgi:hypothetical protein
VPLFFSNQSQFERVKVSKQEDEVLLFSSLFSNLCSSLDGLSLLFAQSLHVPHMEVLSLGSS